MRRSRASPTCSRSTPPLTGREIADLEEAYAGRGYGDFKNDLAEVVVDFVTPFRDRTLELLEDRAELDADAP